MKMADSEADDRRFASVNEEEILRILSQKDSKSTKKCIDGAVNTLRAWSLSKSVEFETILNGSAADLDMHLRTFFAEARTKSGELYTKRSMISIR